MSKSANELGAKAQIDFHCFDPECDGIVKFNLADIAGREFQAVCRSAIAPMSWMRR